MISVLEIFQRAKSEGWAIGAFNAGNLEILQAIVNAAENQRSPVIVETSVGEAGHFGVENFLDVVENSRQRSGLPILTNFDHGPGLEECQKAIEQGYDLVHFDGSHLPYEENIKITKILGEMAKQKGVLIEGEFNRMPGDSSWHDELAESIQATADYTDPEMAADFVARTGCDILAVMIGNLHGLYRQPERINLELLKIIGGKINCFFSLHGGSGLLAEDVRRAVSLGVVKVNVNTELRLTFRQTLDNVLKGSEEIVIYKIMPPVIAAVQKVVEEKMELFGSSGKAKSFL